MKHLWSIWLPFSFPILNLDSVKNFSVSSAAIAGALTGCSVRLLVNPFDVIKIRWQLQAEIISTNQNRQMLANRGYNSKYQSWLQTCRNILNEEGVKSFWKGHLSGQALTIVYNSVQFSTYKFLTQKLKDLNYSKDNFLLQFAIGGFSGSVATVAALPLDVIRTRMVSQGAKPFYSSIPDAILKIHKADGAIGFYRGTVPAVVQTFPAAGLTFGFYKMFHTALRQFPIIEENVVNVASGFFSGLLVKVFVHPLDVFKKRLMIQVRTPNAFWFRKWRFL